MATTRVSVLSSKDEFDKFTKDPNQDPSKVSIIFFYAIWCGPCEKIAPQFKKLSLENSNLNFYQVDNEETAIVCGISAMPTFQFYKNGQKIDELVGANKEKLEEMINKYKA